MSGFYAWSKRPLCARKREDGELSVQIATIFHDGRQSYGSPRVHAQLRKQGIHCGRKRVVRLMQELQLSARLPCHRVVTTRSDASARFAPNVLDRQFEATMPDEKWVADVTYVPTEEGTLSVAVVLDLFSRRISGWAMAASQTDELVMRALHMALMSRRPGAGLLHHSDRGRKSHQWGLSAALGLLADSGEYESHGQLVRQRGDGALLCHPQRRRTEKAASPDTSRRAVYRL